MSFTSAAKFCVYDSWDLSRPKVSPRSRLYHLKPIGVGTALSESCTGYIARLAAEHCTSVGSLFNHRLAPASNKCYLKSTKSKPDNNVFRSFFPATQSLNGLGATARDWVEVLERLTQQCGLRYLTMLRWQNVLSEKSLCRSLRAWCPLCYEEQRESGSVIYDYLLWSLSTVEVCPIHQRMLEAQCPQCYRQLRPLDSRSRPGYCCRCDSWLGHSQSEEGEPASPLGPNELRYKLWVANQMAELIAAAPKMTVDPPQNRVTEFVPSCINRITAGNVSAFARLVNVNKMTVYAWCYDRAVPQNDLILKVCHATGASFVDILTNQKVSPNFDLVGPSHRQVLFTPGFRRHLTGAVRRALLAALKKNPPPSIREVGESLGYKSADFLYSKYSDLCKMLTARYRKSLRNRNRSLPLNRTHVDDQTLKRALQKALKEAVPPSLDGIGKRLGYQARFDSRRDFQRKFPELCQMILERRAAHRAKHQHDLRIKLEAILLEDPPPTLDEVIKRLGYKANTYLRDYYPTLCSAIVIRHAEYRKAQFNRIPHKLRAILREEPPVSLRAAATRLGRNPAYLGSRFPDVCQAISRRYALFRREQGLEKKEETAKRVRAMAFHLDSAGVYPSRKQIKSAFGNPIGLNNSEIGAVLDELRSQFKSIKGG
jgi:hypothetical protein